MKRFASVYWPTLEEQRKEWTGETYREVQAERGASIPGIYSPIADRVRFGKKVK